eukprot:gene14943-biopygen6237
MLGSLRRPMLRRRRRLAKRDSGTGLLTITYGLDEDQSLQLSQQHPRTGGVTRRRLLSSPNVKATHHRAEDQIHSMGSDPRGVPPLNRGIRDGRTPLRGCKSLREA